jgi:predicted MPP superfamily phosphohydrolase
MRCLLAADLHYSLPQFDWVKEVAGHFDSVVLAGDHLDLGSIVDFRAQSAVVKNYIGKLKEKTQLLVCSGNHDLDSTDQTGEKISRWILGARSQGVPCDGDSLVFSDTLFRGGLCRDCSSIS